MANTDVNFCEKNKNEAKKSNIFFIKKLVKLIQKNNLKVHLIQFSSDQVYSGKGNHGENKERLVIKNSSGTPIKYTDL